MDFSVVKKSLEELGYKVSCFDTAAEAVEYLDREIDGTTVGTGGSQTMVQMGLLERLAKHNTLYARDRIPEGTPVPEHLHHAREAEVFLSGVNAIAETGEIVNIDATGNRVSGSIYGPKKVYFITGENKLTPNYECALWRARNIAAPKNAQRLGRKTPCAVHADKCYNCKSPDRICKVLSVFWTKPGAIECEVILIHEMLGY